MVRGWRCNEWPNVAFNWLFMGRHLCRLTTVEACVTVTSHPSRDDGISSDSWEHLLKICDLSETAQDTVNECVISITSSEHRVISICMWSWREGFCENTISHSSWHVLQLTLNRPLEDYHPDARMWSQVSLMYMYIYEVMMITMWRDSEESVCQEKKYMAHQSLDSLSSHSHLQRYRVNSVMYLSNYTVKPDSCLSLSWNFFQLTKSLVPHVSRASVT